MAASSAAKKAYNTRETANYHAYVAARAPLKGGQKGFRAIMRKLPVAKRPLSLLGMRQRATRAKALGVLSRSRRWYESLTKASHSAHTSPETVRRYLGRSGFRKVGARWRSTKADSLIRVMASYEDGRGVQVTTRHSKTATLLARYARSVRAYFEDPARDPHVLDQFRGVTYKDAKGNARSFETDPYALRRAIEKTEAEFGAFDIYPEGGADESSFAEA